VSLFRSNVVKLGSMPLETVLKWRGTRYILVSMDVNYGDTGPSRSELVLRCTEEWPPNQMHEIPWYTRSWNAIRKVALTPVLFPKIRT